MSVRIIKKSWWVDLTFNRTRYRRRSPENSRAGALAYEAVLRQRLARGENINREPPSQEPTFEQFAARWFRDYVTANNKFSERRNKGYILNASLNPFFGRMPIREITSAHIEAYKAREVASGISNKTINNRLTVLSKCISVAYEWQEFQEMPPKIKKLKCTSARTDYLSDDECRRLLANTNGVLHDFIIAGLRTGLREGELKGLQWSDIDFDHRILTVRHSWCDYRKVLDTPKSNRERHIPLGDEVYEVLFRRRRTSGFVFTVERGQPLSHKRLILQLARACERAGIRRTTSHVLRHTFASHLVAKGIPLNVVQSLLGHSSVTTTMRYAHIAPSSLRAAVDLLTPSGDEKLGQPVGNPWPALQQKKSGQESLMPKNTGVP